MTDTTTIRHLIYFQLMGVMSSAFLPGTSSACQSEFNLVSHILDRAILFLLDCEAHQSPIVRCVSWCGIPALLFRADKPQNRDHDNHSYKSFRNPVISTGVKWGLTPPFHLCISPPLPYMVMLWDFLENVWDLEKSCKFPIKNPVTWL